MAPEIITQHNKVVARVSECTHAQQLGYDASVDVWALGVSAITMLQGEPPHWSLEPLDVLKLLKKGR
jgi:serine/threonine protein kinase